MDAAIFVPDRIGSNNKFVCGCKWNVFEWFGMIHGISVNIVIERLENLKRKSLVENIGDGFTTIGMHDLWREFAKLETKVGEFEKRRWMFEWDEHNVLEEARVMTGDSWRNLRRMYFQEQGFMKLEEVDFDCFPNVTVLKLSRKDFSPVQLDVSGLKHLKSLELDSGKMVGFQERPTRYFPPSFGLGGLLELSFLRWSYVPANSPCIDDIGQFTKLQVLDLSSSGRLPDLRNLVLLRVVCFHYNTAKTVTGLSSKHTNLCYLDFEGCTALQSCRGLGELVALQELRLIDCSKLKKVPNLQKLKRLRRLDVSNCKLLTALPGLGDLVSLLELEARGCKKLVELPDLCNLSNLRILDLSGCKLIKSLPGLDELVCLQSLYTLGCRNLTEFPDMRKLTNLQALVYYLDRPLQSTAGLSDLISLQHLSIYVSELHEWLDLRKLTKLEKLYIAGWHVQGLSSLVNCVLLESLTVQKCKGEGTLPDLQKLTRLHKLELSNCEFEDMSSLSNLTRLEDLRIVDCNKLEAIPDLRNLVRLKSVHVERCTRLRDFRGVLALRNLEWLHARGHPWLYENMGPDLGQLTGLHYLNVSYGGFADLQAVAACSQLQRLVCRGCPIMELPDLANFPKLETVDVSDCVNLTKLTCTGPLSAEFWSLNVQGCWSLRALPDLSNARVMVELNVANSGVVMTPEFIMFVKARWPNILLDAELSDSE